MLVAAGVFFRVAVDACEEFFARAGRRVGGRRAEGERFDDAAEVVEVCGAGCAAVREVLFERARLVLRECAERVEGRAFLP